MERLQWRLIVRSSKSQAVASSDATNIQTVAMVSRGLGVAAPTLYGLKRHFESKGFLVPAQFSNPEKWDSKSKLAGHHSDRIDWN